MAVEETNVFVEFGIVQASDLKRLADEFDILIAARKKIFLWSKTITPAEMQAHCKALKIGMSKEEKELHEKCWKLRKEELKTFKEIAEQTETSMERVSFYVKVDPAWDWTLDDWIAGYYHKDSSVYPKVDVVIDNNKDTVNRFIRAGRTANFIEKV